MECIYKNTNNFIKKLNSINIEDNLINESLNELILSIKNLCSLKNYFNFEVFYNSLKIIQNSATFIDLSIMILPEYSNSLDIILDSLYLEKYYLNFLLNFILIIIKYQFNSFILEFINKGLILSLKDLLNKNQYLNLQYLIIKILINI